MTCYKVFMTDLGYSIHTVHLKIKLEVDEVIMVPNLTIMIINVCIHLFNIAFKVNKKLSEKTALCQRFDACRP